VFRLDYPEATEEGCAACELTGGTTVETQSQARALEKLLPHSVEVGDELCEPACLFLPDHHLAKLRDEWARAGVQRECPRVALDERNNLPATLCAMSNRESLRQFVIPYFEIEAGEMPADERAGVMKRVVEALQSAEVDKRMNPRPQSKDEANG
jgi:hypothetical protein